MEYGQAQDLVLNIGLRAREHKVLIYSEQFPFLSKLYPPNPLGRLYPVSNFISYLTTM